MCYNCGMLVSSQQLIGAPVLSVRAGGSVTNIAELVIDPDQLKIVAFRCAGGPVPPDGANLLSATSVREYSIYGFVIDDIEDLVAQGEVVRIDEALRLNFHLLGLKVETKKGTKLGKISNFTVNSDDFLIQQLIVQRPPIKALMDPELTIPRQEIIEVTDDKIVVKDEEQVLKQRAAEQKFVPNFVNPFRNQEPGFAPADTENPDDKDN